MFRGKRLALFCCLVCVVFLVIVFDPFDDRGPIQNQPEGKSTPVPVETDLSKTPTPVLSPFQEKPETESVTQSIRPATGTTVIQLVDALDDPIPNGRITLASRKYESARSDFEIKDVTQGTHTLVAEAEGYFSATETVSLPAKQPVEMILEYKCAFEIEVFQEGKGTIPAEGAEVTLFEGPPVPRPVSSRIVALCNKDPVDDGRLVLARAAKEIRIVDCRGPQPRVFLTGRPGRRTVYPEPGDKVVTVNPGLRMPEGFARFDSQLRLWDSIAALCSNRGKPESLGSFRTKRGTLEFPIDFFYKVPQTSTSRTVAAATTGPDGKCRFEDLPPRVYWVEARQYYARAASRTLCPLDRFIRMRLTKEEENAVDVVVRCQDLRGHREKYIENADVQLRGLGNLIVLSGQTSKNGRVRFEPVPWGKYSLSITPPDDVNAMPASKQIEISVQRPETLVTVEFQVQFGFSVSGQVIHADTKQAVSRYPLKLKLNPFSRRERSRQRKVWIDYASTTSDSNGHFKFTHVKPGEFLLTGFAAREQAANYLHSSHRRPLDNVDPQVNSEPQFTVVDKDVHDIIYTVVPVVETRFSGTVVTEDGQPVSGAEILLDDLSKDLFQSGDLSRENGRFDLIVILPESRRYHETTVRALVKDRPIKQVSIYREGTPSPSYHCAGLSAQGISPVCFRPGDNVRDMRIVVQSEDKGHILVGRIITPNGQLPQPVQSIHITARQSPSQSSNSSAVGLHGRVEDDGGYRIERLQPGPFRLQVIAFKRYGQLFPGEISLPPPITYSGLTVNPNSSFWPAGFFF